jgi:hypothetical protein
MDRDTVIERLIADQLEKLGVGQYSRRFLQVVEREFRGFAKMSDDDLALELARRGLTSDPLPDPADYDFEDDEDDDDDEASWLVQDFRRGADDGVASRG